jgi:hypothetical protein
MYSFRVTNQNILIAFRIPNSAFIDTKLFTVLNAAPITSERNKFYVEDRANGERIERTSPDGRGLPTGHNGISL